MGEDTSRPWFVTRAREDCDETLVALRSEGIHARALPCIARVPLPWPAALVPARAGRTLAFVTSPFAARIVAAHARDRWDGSVLYAAIAPATAAVLTGAGLSVAISAQGGAAELALAVHTKAREIPIERVLYPTSDAGLDAPEQARAMDLLAGVTKDVRRAPVYATGPAPGLHESLRALPRSAGLVFFSPSAVNALLDAADVEVLASALALCVGASTARAWNERAPSRALITRADALPDAIRALTSGDAQPPPEGR